MINAAEYKQTCRKLCCRIDNTQFTCMTETTICALACSAIESDVSEAQMGVIKFMVIDVQSLKFHSNGLVKGTPGFVYSD